MKSEIAALAFSLACLVGPAHSASNFSVSPGTWIVTNEINGLPGRGMGIEVRDDFLLMSVYNYTPTGQATFHLTMGPVKSNKYTGDLRSYRGGRYFGGPALDGQDNGSAGQVQIKFTSATTGTIQFPGEQEQAISRYVFDGLQPGEILGYGTGAIYMLTALDSGNQPRSGAAIALNNTDARGLRTDNGPCQVSGDTATCDIPWEFGKSTATVSFRRFGRQLEGTYQRKGTSTQYRMIGTRLASSNIPATADSVAYDTPTRGWTTEKSDGYSVPEPGLWGISSELNGKPGRGMVMDLQASTLFMQMYAYEPDGSPTFRVGMGEFKNGTSTLAMQKVRGGRYFGSGALSGALAGSDGNAQVRFTSTTTGQIRLPGEDWVDMQKLMVGAVSPNPASLLGKWLTLDIFGFAGVVSKIDDLTQVKDGKAQDATGSTKCWFETTPQGTVRCKSFSREYRFTPAYGVQATAASTMVMEWDDTPTDEVEETLVLVQRIVDSNGVVSVVSQK